VAEDQPEHERVMTKERRIQRRTEDRRLVGVIHAHQST
jgi:hypothetical protein